VVRTKAGEKYISDKKREPLRNTWDALEDLYVQRRWAPELRGHATVYVLLRVTANGKGVYLYL
jgi:hypothetical protein